MTVLAVSEVDLVGLCVWIMVICCDAFFEGPPVWGMTGEGSALHSLSILVKGLHGSDVMLKAVVVEGSAGIAGASSGVVCGPSNFSRTEG